MPRTKGAKDKKARKPNMLKQKKIIEKYRNFANSILALNIFTWGQVEKVVSIYKVNINIVTAMVTAGYLTKLGRKKYQSNFHWLTREQAKVIYDILLNKKRVSRKRAADEKPAAVTAAATPAQPEIKEPVIPFPDLPELKAEVFERRQGTMRPPPPHAPTAFPLAKPNEITPPEPERKKKQPKILYDVRDTSKQVVSVWVSAETKLQLLKNSQSLNTSLSDYCNALLCRPNNVAPKEAPKKIFSLFWGMVKIQY